MDPSRSQRILIEHDLVALPPEDPAPASRQSLVTLLSNIAYYGYALSEPAYAAMSRAGDAALATWWPAVREALETITGDDKKMDDFVVYKNFPAEVIAMDQVDYWSRQILMYWGYPDAMFTEEPAEREPADEALPVKVLHPAGDDSLAAIRDSLLRSAARWTGRQLETICELAAGLPGPIAVAEAPFKENMVVLAIFLLEEGLEVSVGTATDALRLAVGMSDGDVSLREPSKLRRFTRAERRFLLGLLEQAPNLSEDLARRRGQFKRLMFELKPGDYKDRFPKVVAAYDTLYRSAPIPTHAGRLEKLLIASDPAAIAQLKARPGDFMRRLRRVTAQFGADGADAFVEVMPRLSTTQLLKIERYLETVNKREHRTFPPRGNWSKLVIKPLERRHRFDTKLATRLAKAAAAEVRRRVIEVVPTVRMSPAVERIKLQGNDSDLTPYGRGTVFSIPDEITFLRTASYWESGPTPGNLWYDNGWNFFDGSWAPLGACCWNANTFGGKAAVFSGDPTNSKDLEGRACQLIDLYLDKLAADKVRFAVWNLLCYSRKSFDDAVEVHAALQWGEKPQKGKLFEPSRCAFSFPVRGANMTKYIAYIDIVRREMIYVDANLYGRVNSAAANQKILAKTMPAFVEYLAAQPSVRDLFKGVPGAPDGMPVLYDDSDDLLTGERAYVFQPRNRHGAFEAFDLRSIL